jgi:hypothetical protein
MNGSTDSECVFSSKDPMAAPLIRAAQEEDAAVRALVSPAGALGLDPHLDARRLEWGITDAAFAVQAAFDRVLVWQIPVYRDGFAEGGKIFIPQTAQDRAQQEAPRGILVSAGLAARDQLESHGILLGDVVTLLRLAPFRLPCEMVGGRRLYLLVLSAGDIVGSEDTATRLRNGLLMVQRVDVPGAPPQYTYKGCGNPVMPVMPEDY